MNRQDLFRKLRNWLLVGAACSLFILAAFAQARGGDPAQTREPQAQWGEYGLELCNTAGNTPQQNPRVIALADGGQIIAWEDGRAGFSGVFVQKVDDRGNKLWSGDGIQVNDCPGHGNQSNARLIDDGSGGAIIVWQEYCRGNSDIFAQRFGVRGERLWGEKGVIVCAAEAGQFAPELANDGAGGAIITWHDYRSGSGEDIYVQRLSGLGEPLWPKDGVIVSSAPGTQWYPQIVSDGTGGAVITWSDGRVSSADNNIYAQRLDAAGKMLWPKDGLPVCEAAQNQEKPVMIASPQGVIIAWNDSRNGNIDIYAQKINWSGSVLWDKDGSPVTLAPYNQTNPRLASDGAGGAVAVWTDNQQEESAIYAQKIGADGRMSWVENGRLLARAPAKQENPEIIKMRTADWLVVWEDYRKGFPLLFTQKVTGSGALLWPQSGVVVAPGTGPQEKPSLSLTADGSCYLVWQDRRRGNYDIFAQILGSPDGAPQLAGGGAVFCATPGSVVHQNARLIDAGRGEAIIAFEDARNGFVNIYAQKVGSDGTLLWGKDGLPLARIKADQYNPLLVSDGAGGAIVCWEDRRDPSFPRIFAQRIGGNGAKLWPEGSAPVAKTAGRQSNSAIVSDGAGGAIICWEDERDPLSLKDIYAQRLSPRGDLIWGKNGLAVCKDNGEQSEVALTADGAGGAFFSWTDCRQGERNPDIYAQRLSAGGKPLWRKEGALICGAPDIQRTPQVNRDGEGGVIIAWTDKGGGSYDIYAQRLNSEGKPLWLSDGIPVNQTGRTQQNPLINDDLIIVWEDYRFGNWDIYINALSDQGKLLWGEDGVPIVSLPLTQYAPVIAPWKKQGLLLAWEDYRNGQHYEIFMQKFNFDGKPEWQANGLRVKTTNGARAPRLLPLSSEDSFIMLWEDYTGGGKALYAQKFTL
jgi:hypothetical protein